MNKETKEEIRWVLEVRQDSDEPMTKEEALGALVELSPYLNCRVIKVKVLEEAKPYNNTEKL